jgi:lysyl-tRNA synthetase class 2
MPESAGIAFGVDRLVMLFCDQTTIDAVVAFTPEEL